MLLLITSFVVAAAVALMVIHSARTHEHLSADVDLAGPQKFHAVPVPRVGGIGMFAGLLGAIGIGWLVGVGGTLGIWLMVAGLPAFISGLAEDLTKRVTPAVRLCATVISAALGIFLLDAAITRTDLPVLDSVVATSLGAWAVTIFTVAGVANAINIIDGFNGLSSMCVSLMLLVFAYVAHQVGDISLALWALAGVGAALGFFVWNFPAGLILLGDGGAYFLGFYLAEIGVLLIARNSEISPLFPLMVCIYPVFETVFSMYRRRVVRSVPFGMPDGIHLHSLVYRRLMRWAVGARDARELTRRNSMTAPYLWMLCFTSLTPAMLFWDSTAMILVCIGLFGATYVFLYRRIVRFRTPKWLVVRR